MVKISQDELQNNIHTLAIVYKIKDHFLNSWLLYVYYHCMEFYYTSLCLPKLFTSTSQLIRQELYESSHVTLSLIITIQLISYTKTGLSFHKTDKNHRGPYFY